jgi:hypothetical protein
MYMEIWRSQRRRRKKGPKGKEGGILFSIYRMTQDPHILKLNNFLKRHILTQKNYLILVS